MSKGIAAGAAAVALSALAAVGLDGTAQATPTSITFRLCNFGTDYKSLVRFPDRGGFVSNVLSYGQCWNGTVDSGESFQLIAQLYGPYIQKTTAVDHANSTRTIVTTQGTYSTFSYAKQ